MANNFLGISSSSEKLKTPRTITITGNGSGSATFDGTANMAINLTNNYAAKTGGVNVADTRAVNSPPSYYSISLNCEFKQSSVIGIPDGSTNTYAGLVTLSPYSDQSGGNDYQTGYFYSAADNFPVIYQRTANGAASAWNPWYYQPTLNQNGGYWGFNLPTNNSYFRVPPTGLLPDSSSAAGIGTLGTATWPFLGAYIKNTYGNLVGNASTASNASNAGYATSAGSATNATNSTNTTFINGTYTGNGGNQPPSYIPNGKIRFNMMNGLTGLGNVFSGTYADCMLMDAYTGGDVPYVTGFAVAKQTLPEAWIFTGSKNGAAWTDYAKIITSKNIASQSVSYSANSGALGGVGAANYLNTTDTLILKGTI